MSKVIATCDRGYSGVSQRIRFAADDHVASLRMLEMEWSHRKLFNALMQCMTLYSTFCFRISVCCTLWRKKATANRLKDEGHRDCAEVVNSQIEGERLLVLFLEVPSKVRQALGVRHMQGPTFQMDEVDSIGEVVTAEEFVSDFLRRFLRFSDMVQLLLWKWGIGILGGYNAVAFGFRTRNWTC